MSNSNRTSGGVGIVTVVQIVLVILKLCKLIDWSWWVVLLPIEIEVGLLLLIILVAIIRKIIEKIWE